MRGVERYWGVYYLIYVVSVAIFLGLQWASLNRDNYIYLLAAIFGAAVGIALLSGIFVEGVGRMVLLIPAVVKRLRDQGREEGLERGREEGLEGQRNLQQQWVSWYERHQAAQRDGQPFTEPPPAGPPSRNGK